MSLKLQGLLRIYVSLTARALKDLCFFADSVVLRLESLISALQSMADLKFKSSSW